MTAYRYHQDKALPLNGEIFVFGSNLQGRHGLGAAKVAVDQFGAIYGEGEGIMGQAYAIPTKYPFEPYNKKSLMGVISLSGISLSVDRLKQYATDNPEKVFFITRIGCGLAGHNDASIARLFRESPANCNFAQEWKQYLEPEIYLCEKSLPKCHS